MVKKIVLLALGAVALLAVLSQAACASSRPCGDYERVGTTYRYTPDRGEYDRVNGEYVYVGCRGRGSSGSGSGGGWWIVNGGGSGGSGGGSSHRGGGPGWGK